MIHDIYKGESQQNSENAIRFNKSIESSTYAIRWKISNIDNYNNYCNGKTS